MGEYGMGKAIIRAMNEAIETAFGQFVHGTQPTDEANVRVQIERGVGPFKSEIFLNL
jgi:hypothetical protein